MDNKLSLTKKLDGGYLHVKRSKKTSYKKSKGYSSYLSNQGGGVKDGVTPTQVSIKKVVKLGNKRSKSSKSKQPVKQRKEVNEPFDVSKLVPKQSAKPEVESKPEVMAKPKVASKPEVMTKPKVAPKPKVASKPEVKPKHVKPHVRRKSHTKRARRGGSKRRGVGKRVSITKTRKYSNKDISKIQTKLRDIRKKSSDEIKKELDNQGIQLTGKSPEILKDIYMYSQLCGITIKRE